ncbi:MAG: fatty acid--CoA ligase, partial [Peptococcaceae bacterium]|nr:fatty acid--CoA ligase [Peptococcaceae bacterium]
WISGRLDDVIMTGVDKVYPQEVEEVLKAHPGVLDAAVAGLPGEGGEPVLTAFVVAREEGLTPEMLEQFVGECDRLAAYKMPSRYVFVKELPRTATGKLLRCRLKLAR